MNEQLPAPLVPPEVDLRGYEFMPLYGGRLRDSDFNSLATDAEYRAAHNLWWSAWQQVPAASLPADDITLCKLADLHRDQAQWQRVKARALHGFIMCSDGRFYHEALAPLAIEAFSSRRIAQARGKLGASKRWSKMEHENNIEHPSLLDSATIKNYSSTIKNDSASNALTIEKNSRGEERIGKKNPSATSPPGFDDFWQIYPRKDAKQAAVKAWRSIAPPPDLQAALLEALASARQSDQWRKDGGQFVPHAATWLNQRRWEDSTAAPAAEPLGARV